MRASTLPVIAENVRLSGRRQLPTLATAPLAFMTAVFIVGCAVSVEMLPDARWIVYPGLMLGTFGCLLAAVVRPAAVCLLAAALAFGLARGEVDRPAGASAQAARALVGRAVQVDGRLLDDPRPVGGGFELLVVPVSIGAGESAAADVGSILVRSRGEVDALPGDRVRAAGVLTLPGEHAGFDRRAWLARRQTYLELPAAQVSVSHAEGPPGWAGAVRRWYREQLASVMEAPHGAVLVGIVLGIRAGVPAALERDLIATGLVHLLVLSGLKVAVFARLVQAALSPLSRTLSTGAGVALVALYCVVGGATPAAVRAASMGILALLAARLGRSTHVWTSLGVVGAVMVAWDPSIVDDGGYLLSFVGTAGIVLLTPTLEHRLHRLPPPVREPAAVTLAAQVATLPISAGGFGLIALTAPLSNAVTLPLLPLLVGAGLVLAPLAFVAHPLGYALALPVTGLLLYIEWVAHWLARWPGAAVAVASFPTWLGLAYYAAAGGVLAAAVTHGPRRRAALAAGAIVPLIISAVALGAWDTAPAGVTILDVGDGQAVLLRGPGGAILVDGGPSPDRLAAGVGATLPPWRSTLAAVVVTSPGLAHTGGLAGLSRQTAMVIVGDGTPYAPATLDLLRLSSPLALTRTVVGGGEMQAAGLRLEVLAPEATVPGDGGAEGNPVALRIVGSHRVFCDFSELSPEAQALAAVRLRGPCDVVLLPGSGQSPPDPALRDRWGDPVLVASTSRPHRPRGVDPRRFRSTAQEGSISFDL